MLRTGPAGGNECRQPVTEAMQAVRGEAKSQNVAAQRTAVRLANVTWGTEEPPNVQTEAS